MPGQDAVGFWSYVHADDAADDERITKLASRLSAFYGLATGRELDLFVDHDSIVWGEAWRERIDNAITGTTFFFPVITPRYFESPQCRRELLKFVSEARTRGVENLLLPIYYVTVDELEHNPTDEAMVIVAARQRVDLRAARLADESASGYRTIVDRLARTVADVSDELAASPREGPPRAPLHETAGPVDPELGASLDRAPVDVAGELLEAATSALKSADAINEQLTREITKTGDLSRRAMREIDESAADDHGADGREVLQRFAGELRDPSRRIQQLGQEYARTYIEASPSMLSLFDILEANEFGANILGPFANSIHEMYEASRRSAEAYEDYLKSLQPLATLSRGLQEPIGHLRAGVFGVLDGVAVVEEWDARVKALGAHQSATEGEPRGEREDETRTED